MAQWCRLADYFIVIGYQHDKEAETGSGKVIQRFPETDWPDVPFTPGIEYFCQPGGWGLSELRQEPTFFVSVLTDSEGGRHYCACLTFYEPYDDQKSDGEPGKDDMVLHSAMFAPKSIVLISQLDYFDTFRHCLGVIYTVYVDGNLSCHVEELVGNILGCIMIPPAGGPQVRFTIGAGDRQALQPPLSSTIPTTKKTVAVFFQELGIHNVVTLVCAALTDHKILFTSRSYSRLGDASHALSSLLYPLKYSYVYIPLLPAVLVEVLHTPTPFIAGIHSTLREETSDALDLIIVDCDNGSISIPECVHNLPNIPEPMHSRLLENLCVVLNPGLTSADFAFSKQTSKTGDLERLDKEIRAVFIRFFAELFTGYRSCLQIVRIQPTPVIKFHKAKFLGLRNLTECEFSRKVLDSMSFQSFVQFRGAPFRICDVFDEVFANFPNALQEESSTPSLLLQHIQDIAHTLYINENPSTQPYTERIPKPTEGAHSRTHLPKFPIIDWLHVQEIIDKGQSKREAHQKHMQSVRTPPQRIVPIGVQFVTEPTIHAVQHRRLEVLHNCIKFIFENKISDARKIYPAVLRALKNKTARHALTEDLKRHAAANKSMLDHQQFLLVVKLLNALLQNESPLDENGIAARILPLADNFCRKLSTGIIQFAYTCIQEHAVWGNQQFWESTFYEDVQRQIKNLYLSIYKEKEEALLLGPNDGETVERSSQNSLVMEDVSCLELAAEELRKARYVNPEKLKEFAVAEEGIIYSQAIHFCNRMVYLKIPLDISKGVPFLSPGEESASSNLTPSIADSVSMDAESGFEEQDISEVGASVTKIVARFVEKVCKESDVLEEHLKALHLMVPGVVSMHVETIDHVCRESKRLPPILKPKITAPYLLPGEEIVVDGLRAYLLVDGREEHLPGQPGTQLLPAEGAIFLTSYRVIFKGTPCDQYACEQSVLRACPVSSIGKEKKLNSEYFAPLETFMQHVLEIRSYTFQLLKLAFDEEVNEETVEHFRKSLYKLRNPSNVLETFAFTGASYVPISAQPKRKERYHTLRDFGKTLKKSVRKTTGMKPSKSSDRKQKYVLSGQGSLRGIPSSLMEESPSRPGSIYGDEETWSRSHTAYATVPRSWHSLHARMLSQEDVLPMHIDPKSQERLSELLCYRDFVRLELISSHHAVGQRSRGDQFFLSNINANYTLCRSYPGLLILPANIFDDSLMRFGRSHRQNRFPVITWRHPKTKALLLRASAFHNKSMMGKFKSQGHHQVAHRDSTGSLSNSLEMDKYLHIICSLTPAGKNLTNFGSISNTLSMTLTPLDSRERSAPSRFTDSSVSSRPVSRMRMSHASTGLTVSATNSRASDALTSPRLFSRQFAVTPLSVDDDEECLLIQRQNSITSFTIGGGGRKDFSSANVKGSSTLDRKGHISEADHHLSQAALYVMCDKSQSKAMKTDHIKKCEFVSVDYGDVASVKISFKKLLRACVPGTVSSDPDFSFHKQVEDSGWLVQIQHIIQYSGACVDLLDEQGSSVLLALEDGWDITAQIASVVQVLLDPYYRTLEGFHTLIEKEWLSFGHRFAHRGHQTANNPSSSFAPIFLQFLDVIHQIMCQFPLSFEFNHFFLKFLAFHYLSNRFRTFMLDSECERLEAGWLLDDRPKIGMAAADVSVNMGTSVWDYIDLYSTKSPVFHNFHYIGEENGDPVLRPYSNMANLEIWDYYTEENLAHGPPFDLELVAKETQLQASEMALEDDALESSGRVIMNQCYDNVELSMPNSFTSLLQEIATAEKELNQFQSKWRDVVDRLEQPQSDAFRRQYSLSTQYYRSHGRHVHKRSTIEFLVRGKVAPQASKMFSQPHAFEKHHYNAPAHCNYCSHILWGFMKPGLKCSGCGYDCHEKCMSHVPKNCASGRLKGAGEDYDRSVNANRGEGQSPISDEDRTFSSSVANTTEQKTYEGYLSKQGALFKGWKPRWFILDSMKHQLRYYDDKDGGHCRGFIDLAEVQSVNLAKTQPGVPRTSYFEMKTTKRSYCFMADNCDAAQKWVAQIQNRISS